MFLIGRQLHSNCFSFCFAFSRHIDHFCISRCLLRMISSMLYVMLKFTCVCLWAAGGGCDVEIFLQTSRGSNEENQSSGGLAAAHYQRVQRLSKSQLCIELHSTTALKWATFQLNFWTYIVETTGLEWREEERADGEVARGAGGVYFPQETQCRRAGRTQLWFSGLEDGAWGDQSHRGTSDETGIVCSVQSEWGSVAKHICNVQDTWRQIIQLFHAGTTCMAINNP